jgi:hypothetical protein
MGDPTYDICTGMVGFNIDKGHCDDTSLDGLSVIATFYFPRAIHHGEGVMQPIIDERANDAQKDALFYIMSGEDQPIGTMFQIFSVIIETNKEPSTGTWTSVAHASKCRKPCARTASRSATQSQTQNTR